jgi:hypothetical protein
MNEMEQRSTLRILEIAQFLVGENSDLAIDDTSFVTIVDDIARTIVALGDLSFCLEAPVKCTSMCETPRPPIEVETAVSHRVYEEMLCHRFPKADRITTSQHAEANYYRFVTLQKRRNHAEHAEHDTEEPTQIAPRTIFHDSGIGTSHRHESSYAQSLMSFARRSHEQYAKILPKLPEAWASGTRFDCFICLRKVQIADEDLWK